MTKERANFLIKVTEVVQALLYAAAFFMALGCPWLPSDGCSEKLISFSAWVLTYGIIGIFRILIKWPVFCMIMPRYEGQTFESWIIRGITLFFELGWVILWNVFGVIILLQESDECYCGGIPFRSLTLAAVIIQSICTLFVMSLGGWSLCSKNNTDPLLTLTNNYCTHCDDSLNTTDKFCPSCGAKCSTDNIKSGA